MGTNITGIGNANAIGFKSRVTGGAYFPPELKDALVGVWSAYGKSNDSTDRNIIKNKIKDRGGDFVISNAAFKLNSGFGKYETELSNTRIWTQSKETTSSPFSSSYNGLSGWLVFANTELTNSADMPSFKIQVKGLLEGQELIYRYYDSNGQSNVYSMGKDGEYTLPADIRTAKPQTSNTSGFQVVKNDTNTITITQIPSFEGAFVTDGVNDLITSTKTVQEMGITDKVTVVSMIHQIALNPTFGIATTNYIENGSTREHVRSDVYKDSKTGIYGYSASLINNTKSDINNILGDKADYVTKSTNSLQSIFDSKFSVVGRTIDISEVSSVAWYWTIIANKVLTTDQINQVIAYFNLDKTLKPDILCNVKKQGITNDNHAEFGDKLIDFSGNGRDIQLNNIAWKGDSGIGKYEVDFASLNYNNTTSVFTATYKSCSISKIIKNGVGNIFYNWGQTLAAINSTKIQVIGLDEIGAILEFTYLDESGNSTTKQYSTDGIYDLPASAAYQGDSHNTNFRFSIRGYIGDCDITITQIPSHAGALCLDGVNDFGKVTGMPVYKDYTIVVDYERISGIEQAWAEALISKAYIANQGAFVLMETNGMAKHSYSFGAHTTFNKDDSTRTLLYQSKYKCGDVDLNVGTGIDGDTLWLGTYRDNYSSFFNGAIYSLMSFPYSMSKFLIERQLKKHKLGTLYPNMVEFRPVIKANANYKITYYQIDSTNTWKSIKVGDYIVIGAKLAFQITFDNDASELKEVVSPQLSGIIVEKRPSNPGYNIYSYITSKSPQKINITIDEYIRFEDIVQPYPVLLRFNDENGNGVSWGGKFRVGSTITRIGSIADPESNLLNGLYSISGLSLNGKAVTSSTSIVEKQMVFKTTATWLLDNSKPKCILSPSRLRIPNSSYKLLGYIPDISGHGNNGVIHNSAYAEGSGVNEDGSYQLDGVDDFVTIPTLSSGGKQVLMKVNWNTINSIIYDQRGSGGFAIYCSDYNNPSDSITVPAYKGRNAAGTTYIDGIRNEYIIASQLRNVTHNIVEILDTSYAAGKTNPIIGKSHMNSNYGKMSLYDFVLFDEVSTDEEIKQLNDIIGIEGDYVQKPDYYWDAYGKSNFDADRDTIQQRGVAVGNYDLTNYNHAYDKMSGYGGYSLGRFDKSWSSSNNTSVIVVSRNPYDITLKKLGGNSDWEFNNTELKVISNPVSVKFKSNKNIRVTCDYHYYPVGGNSEGTPLGITSKDLIANKDAIITISPISQENIDKYNIDVNRGYYLIYFQLSSTLAVNEEVTIEMLPLYPNGLVYDGVDDYSWNTSIPALADYTYICKRRILNIPTNGATLLKGSHKTNGGAFIADYGNKWQFNFGQYNTIQGIADGINWQTTNNFNGTPINKGNNTDDEGITVGRFSSGYTSIVFYKLFLYPRTIDMLSINMVKNMMEEDGIIDLTSKLFTDKYTGDFYEMDFNNDFLIGN